LRADYGWTLLGGSSGLCLGHISPRLPTEVLALVVEGDEIEIDIPKRVLRVGLSDEELAKRRKAMEAKGSAAWKPAAAIARSRRRCKPMPQ